MSISKLCQLRLPLNQTRRGYRENISNKITVIELHYKAEDNNKFVPCERNTHKFRV